MNWLIHSTMAGVSNRDRLYYSTAAMLALKRIHSRGVKGARIWNRGHSH